MKKENQILYLFLFALILVFLPMSVIGQCDVKLSKVGLAHLKAAEALLGIATSVDDFEQVAYEYDLVTHSDPEYAPVYLELGKLYTKIGNEKGAKAFDKAEDYYIRCKTLCPDSTDVIDIKLAVLDALRRKYENGPNKFNGIWGIWSTYTGKFTSIVEISANNNGHSFSITDDYRQNIVEKKDNPNGIEYTYKIIFDKQPELRKKGWTHYYDDRDNYADPGYPTTGTYNYDKEIVHYTESITIEKNDVVLKYLKIHTDYYLNGQKTYADTETNWLTPEVLDKYIPPRQRGEKGRVASAIDLGLSIKWASWNIGASKPEDYGGYFAWGETIEKEIYDESNYSHGDYYTSSNLLGDNICNTQYDAAHVLWGDDWRLPSKDEIDELIENCSRKLTEINGVAGWQFTGPNGNSIFLPCAGEGESEASRVGFTRGEGKWILYWSGDNYYNDWHSNCAEALMRDDRFVPFGNCGHKDSGFTIRPVKP